MTSNTAISRRRIVQGTAWTIPVVAATAAAPAFATSPSKCKPTLGWSGDLVYQWGLIPSKTTDQWLEAGGQTTVNSLPAGVKVTSITYQFWIENRDGQNSPGPGAYWMGNPASDKKGSCTTSGCAAAWAPTKGSGFAPTVTNTSNLVSKPYPDGVTRKSWDLNMRWDATRDTDITARYSPGTGSCQNFSTGPSSKFHINYSGVTGLSAAQEDSSVQVVNAFLIVTATLSDGNVLTKTMKILSK